MSISISNAGPFFVKGHKETGSLTSHACAMELVACWTGSLTSHACAMDSLDTSGRATEVYSKRTFASIRCLPSAAGSSEWLHTASKPAYPDSPLFTRSIPTIASLERCVPVFLHGGVLSAFRRSFLSSPASLGVWHPWEALDPCF